MYEKVKVILKKESKIFSWQFLMPLMLASSLNPLNSSMIATALPKISVSLDISAGTAAVLVSALYVVSAVAQPTFGKLAEILGPRKVLLTGVCFAAIGGLIGGAIATFPSLLVARVLIGLGTSAGYPSAMFMITQRANHENITVPGSVLGGLQIASMATSTLGLPLGGLLVGWLGWTSIFYINLPAVLIILVSAYFWLPKDKQTHIHDKKQLMQEIDVIGIILFALTIVSWLMWLFVLPQINFWLLIFAVIFTVILVIWERKAATPFFDVKFLQNHTNVVLTLVRILILAMCVYTVMYGVSQWLEAVHAFSSELTGLLLLPMSAVSALVVLPLAARNLVRTSLVISVSAAIVGAVGLLIFNAATPIWVIILITSIFGIVMGTMSQGNQMALYLQVPPRMMGTASGLLRTFTYIGSIVSSSLINIGFHDGATTAGLHLIAILMVVVSLIATFITIADKSLRTIDN
jgi:MFS family permease